MSSGDELAPYWRDMERRVTSRKPKPRGAGPSGRGPRRKAETDYWMAAGLYEFTNKPKRVPAGAASHGRLSTARVRDGQLDAARLTYETELAPILRASPDLLDLYLAVDLDRHQLAALSIWASDDAFTKVAATYEYREAAQALATHLDLGTLRSDQVQTYRLTNLAPDDEDC